MSLPTAHPADASTAIPSSLLGTCTGTGAYRCTARSSSPRLARRFQKRGKQRSCVFPFSLPTPSARASRFAVLQCRTVDTPAVGRSNSRPARAPAALAPTMRSHPTQESRSRTCQMALKCYRPCSKASGRGFCGPIQPRQTACFGRYFRTSRGKCSGRGCPALFANFHSGVVAAGVWMTGRGFPPGLLSSSSDRSCSRR